MIPTTDARLSIKYMSGTITDIIAQMQSKKFISKHFFFVERQQSAAFNSQIVQPKT